MSYRVAGAALIVLVVVALAALGGGSSSAQGQWPPVSLTQVVSGLTNPTHVTNAADGTNRLFIAEQRGVIRLYKNGALVATPFINIDPVVRSSGNEEGLLSVAFPPDYASKQHFYVYYTDNGGSLQLSRFRVTGANPDIADPASEQKLLTIPHPTYDNHNGGQLAFGPDGYLYMFTGDGGGGGDPFENGQNIEVLLGKALRLDVESNPGSATYLIPPTNPFVGVPGRDEIWAYGLRNPWRATFDRVTDDLYIADVGQNAWEEVNVQPAASTGGENYGWDCYEGNHPYELAGCSTNPALYTWPVTEYSHSFGCSITGGHVYRGSAYPALTGIYFYTDVCTGNFWGLRRAGSGWETHQYPAIGGGVTSFGEDEAGELYLVNRSGTLYRLTGPTVTVTPSPSPSNTVTPSPTVTSSPTVIPSPTVTTSPSQLKLYLPMVFK